VEDEDVESNLSHVDVALIAYTTYIKEVIVAVLKEADPTFVVEENLENISKAIKVSLELTKKIYMFVDAAENATKVEDSKGNLTDLVYLKISELQQIIDDDIGESFPVFENYLTQMLSGIPEAQFLMDHDVILTSTADILYLKLAVKLIRETPVIHLEMFIWWSVVEDLILYTTSSMRALYNEYLKLVTGIETASSRSGYCTSSINKLMGFAVSYLILEDDFTTETKPKVEQMIDNIRRSFNTLVMHNTWMDWETKQKTLRKSAAMKSFIGFPDWIQNRTSLELHYKGVSSLFPSKAVNKFKTFLIRAAQNKR
jgi:predicted metalloendopeptidase